MAVTLPQTILPAAFPDSPTLPDFGAHTEQIYNVKYLTALEEEHSRDLYLQGVMTVGQIARLLEDLCMDNDDKQEIVLEDFSNSETEESNSFQCTQFVSSEKRGHIEAWARAVDLVNNLDSDLMFQPECIADVIDLEDAKATYLRGACVVGDIADLLEDLISGFSDNEVFEHNLVFSPEAVAFAHIPVHASEDLGSDLASRLNSLSARLAKLETDVTEFSKQRCDALTRLKLEVAAEAMAEDRDSVESPLHFSMGDSDPSVISEAQGGLPVARVWTTMDTTISGFSLATPPASVSDVRPLAIGSVKGLLWPTED